MPNWTLHNSIRTISQLNIVKLNNKLGIWARPQGLTRLEGSRIGASPLPLSASLRAKCHPGGWLSFILETSRRQSLTAGADQAGGLKISITTRPNAVACHRVRPGWRVRAQYYNQAKCSCTLQGANQAGGLTYGTNWTVVNWTTSIWTMTFVQLTHVKFMYCSNNICSIYLCSISYMFTCYMFNLLYM